MPPMVVDGGNRHSRWPWVLPGIMRYSFTDLARMEGWVGLAVRGGREICWYDLHRESNLGRSQGSTMVYPLCYSHQNWLQKNWLQFKNLDFSLITLFLVISLSFWVLYVKLLQQKEYVLPFFRFKPCFIMMAMLFWQLFLMHSSF